MKDGNKPGEPQAFLHSLHGKFKRVVELYMEMERTPRRFGTETPMTSTQIHLIEVIGDFRESLGTTELAARKGVSKGAISQNIKKLREMGMIYQESDPENLSRSVVKLTNRGKTAYFAHRAWHETADGGFKKFIEGVEQDKKTFLYDTLSKVEIFLEKLTES